MNHLQLLLFLPAILAIGYSVYRKFRQGKIQDAIAFLVCGIAVLLNALTEYFVLEEITHPRLLKFVQQLVSAMIVPMVYIYFSNQISTRYSRAVQGILWACLMLFALPHVVVFLDDQHALQGEITPWTFYFVREGEVAFRFFTADLILLVQALVTFVRIPPTFLTMRRYGMKLPNTIYYFGGWWILAIGFIIFTSLNDTATLRQPVYNWIYFGSLAFLVLSIYTLLLHDLDLRPRLVSIDDAQNEDDAQSANENANEDMTEEIVVEDVADFAEQSREMAETVRRLIEGEKVYLQPGYTSKDVIALLGTNRTYFSHMMMTEFGCHFSDWVARERVAYAKELMQTSELTLAVIAEQSGFSDNAAMTLKFKQFEGVSPSVWRRAHSTGNLSLA